MSTSTPANISPADWPKYRDLLARENFIFYASEFLRGPPEAPYNGRFFAAAHHEEWADMVNNHKRLCILAARDHGKSFAFTFAYPLWMAERNPGRDGFIFSASQPQAENILIRIMREVENNPRLAHLLPDKKDLTRWSSKCLEFKNHFTLFARGYGTKVRGGHPVMICLDDILNDETAFSETVRAKEIDYFYNAVTNMIIPGGQIVVVGTPFHAKDLYGDLAKNKQYLVREFPAIITKPDEPDRALWPERYNLATLAAKRDEIKSLRFAREFLCKAVTDLSSLFPGHLFFSGKTEQKAVKLGMSWQHWEEAGIRDRYIGVDFALSNEQGNDYTVIFVIGVDGAGNRWIVDIIRERGLSFSEQKSIINTASRKYRPNMIFVESVQAQRIYGDELIRETDLPIRHYITGSEKHGLEKGLPSLRMLFENEKIRIPRGCDVSIAKTDIWIEEMKAHTVQSGRVVSMAEHDDTAMAFWIAVQASRNANFGFSFNEEDGDEAAFDEMVADEAANEDEDAEWGDMIPGAIPRVGRPRELRANVINGEDVDNALDNPRDPHTRHAKKAGERAKAEGTGEWRPRDGSPKAMDIAALTSGRGG